MLFRSAGTAADALARIPPTRPDVAVLDVRLPDGNGVEVCREVRSRHPEIRCLMLTSFSDDEALFQAIMAGAAGYLLKQVRGTDLVTAIRNVAAGQSLLDPAIDRSPAKRDPEAYFERLGGIGPVSEALTEPLRRNHCARAALRLSLRAMRTSYLLVMLTLLGCSSDPPAQTPTDSGTVTDTAPRSLTSAPDSCRASAREEETNQHSSSSKQANQWV